MLLAIFGISTFSNFMKRKVISLLWVSSLFYGGVGQGLYNFLGDFSEGRRTLLYFERGKFDFFMGGVF